MVVGDSSIELVEGDITEIETDAIVNAANPALQMGGGVAGAIRRKGGPAIQRECDRIGGINVGGAVATTAGELKTRFVIHAVGPRWGEGDEDEKLRMATLNSMKVAEGKGLGSIAFPAISTGIFGYPIERCAEIMLTSLIQYLREADTGVRVVLCLYGAEAYEIFASKLGELAG